MREENYVLREAHDMKTTLTVNGKTVTIDAPENTLLVTALREHLRLTGTHIGCDTAQ